MKHRALPRFWQRYKQLPKDVRELADKNFDLLKSDPHHPSLHFKKVDADRNIWSVRIGLQYRALGVESQMAFCGFGSVLTPITTSCYREPKQNRPNDHHRGGFLSEKLF